MWEAIWASPRVSSGHFILFLVLATVQYYRDIILDNNMDFTDVIKFFNGRRDARFLSVFATRRFFQKWPRNTTRRRCWAWPGTWCCVCRGPPRSDGSISQPVVG